MILNRFAVSKSPTHKLTDCYKFNGIKWGNWKIEYLKMKKWELQSLCKTNFKHFNWNKKTCDFYPINRIYSVSMLLQRKKINFFGWWLFLSVSFFVGKIGDNAIENNYKITPCTWWCNRIWMEAACKWREKRHLNEMRKNIKWHKRNINIISRVASGSWKT